MPETPEIDWGDFFRLYMPLARRVARRLAGDAARAEDLAQEAARSTFERHARGALRFESAAHARNYLLRAVRNLAADEARRAAREDPLGEEAASPGGEEPFRALLDADESAAQRERGRAVQAAIRGLRAPERDVLRWRFADGLSYPEIAARTGVAVSTLHARCEAALGKIRAHLGRRGIGT